MPVESDSPARLRALSLKDAEREPKGQCRARVRACAIGAARQRPVLAELREERALVGRKAVAGVGIEVLPSEAALHAVVVCRLRRLEACDVADQLVQGAEEAKAIIGVEQRRDEIADHGRTKSNWPRCGRGAVVVR